MTARARPRGLDRPRLVLLVGGLAVVALVAAVIVALFARADSSQSARPRSTPSGSALSGSAPSSAVASPSATSSAGSSVRALVVPVPSVPPRAPSAPPARVCGSPALAGPPSAPSGAVSVSVGESLSDVVSAHGEGTTYWLEPGVHHLPSGPYSQVTPHSGDTFVGAPGAVLDGRHDNRYAFGGSASSVTISHLTVQNFGKRGDNNNEGVVNHDSAKNWTIVSSTIRANAGAGLMIGSGNRLIGDCLRDNGQYGFNAYSENGVSDVVLSGTEISGNNTDDWERRQPDCGCTGGGKFWATTGATVTGNYVHDNRGVGLWADTNNADFRFEGNYISGNDDEGIFYEISYNAAILNNTFVRNALVKGPTNPSFPAAAVYLSESGSDSRVPGRFGQSLRVSGNVFTDNWAGVVAWENADRFAGSPANTSSDTATLVNPSVASVANCAKPSLVAKPPYLNDCRWKTQNVLVSDNTFALDPTKVPKCTPATGCGFNGVFSNYGTYPAWSPYKALVVEQNITFRQHNVWRGNRYVGPWNFMVKEAGTVVSWAAWRAAPYNQDVGSTLR